MIMQKPLPVIRWFLWQFYTNHWMSYHYTFRGIFLQSPWQPTGNRAGNDDWNLLLSENNDPLG